MTWARHHKLLAAVAAVCIVAFVWSCCEVMTVFYAETSPTVDSRAALRSLALNGTGVTAGQGNAAWSLLVEVFDAVDEVAAELDAMYDAGEFEPRDEWDVELDFDRVLEARTVPGNLKPERHALTLLRNRGVFDKLRRFSGGPPGLRPITGEGPLWSGFRDDDRDRARNLARLRVSALRLAAADGEFTEAAAAFDQTLALARTVAWQPSMLDFMTANSIEALAILELQYELMETDFDERSCRSLLESLDRHAVSPGVAFALEAERVIADDWLQWCYSDDGEGDGYLVSVPLPEEFARPSDESVLESLFEAAMIRFFSDTRAEVRTAHDNMTNWLIAVSLMNAADQARVLSDEGTERFIRHRPFRRTLNAGTRVMVALQLYRSLNGGYPLSLDELDGEPPVDLLHGLPFGYRLLDDDPDGRGYVLYSYGLDGIDDGGVEPDFGWARWSGPLTDPDAAGSDFVINTPRLVWDE